MKNLLRFFCTGLFLFFAWPFFIYKVYGKKKYKLEANTIIIANHYSTFDPFFIYLHFFTKKIYFISITDAKKKLLSRFVTWLFDCIYIDYDVINYQYIKESIKVLKKGGVICVFPEGIINPRKYGFFDFYKSYLLIAEKTKANILPIYLYPNCQFFKKTKIYIGDIQKYSDYSKYPTYDDRNMYFLSLIMDYSGYIEKLEK